MGGGTPAEGSFLSNILWQIDIFPSGEHVKLYWQSHESLTQ
jgi:hypothetical protein